MKLQGIDEYIVEAKGTWKHDVVGKQGSISKFILGSENIEFNMDTKKQMWTYNALISKDGGYARTNGTVPDKYQDAFDDADQKQMTKAAKEILNK